MKVFFGGAEKGTYRTTLLNAGVERIAYNLTHLNIPKKKSLELPEAEIVIYTSPNDEDVERFDRFLRAQADEIDLVIGRPDYDGTWMGEKYYPLWNDNEDLERFAWLVSKYKRVAVPDRAIEDTKVLKRMKMLLTRWDAKAVGITSKPSMIEALPWEAVVVVSWSSPVRYGETQVWDGTTLRRYPAQQKDSVRKRHRTDIERLGVSYHEVVEDDAAAVSLLAIRSWQQYEDRKWGYITSVPGGAEGGIDDDEQEIVATKGGAALPATADAGPVHVATNVRTMRHEREPKLLPILVEEDITPSEGDGGSDQALGYAQPPPKQFVLRVRSQSLRNCDSCYLAAHCPGFEENANCAYDIPVEIKSKDQLYAALRALIEVQQQRVLFAKFAEDMEGNGIDTGLSAEIDRLFAMVAKFSDLSDNRDFIKLEVEAHGNAGMLSRIFGARVGEQARALPGGGMGAAETNGMLGQVLDIDTSGV